jgi:hypothetical protein
MKQAGTFALALSWVTEIGEQAVAAVAASLACGGPVIKGQLIASRFYEAMQRELKQLPMDDPKRAALIAASDQCERIAAARINPTACSPPMPASSATRSASSLGTARCRCSGGFCRTCERELGVGAWRKRETRPLALRFRPSRGSRHGRLLGDKLFVQAPAASGLPHPQGIAGNDLHAATVTAAEPSGLVVAFLGRESDHVEPAKTDTC